jgi:spore coat protein CotH
MNRRTWAGVSGNAVAGWLFAMLALLPLSRGALDVDQAAPFFDPSSVQTVFLEIQPADLERMQQALPQRISVPGVFRWGDQAIANVGIRYKGDSSSNPDARQKRSYLIEFSKFKDQKFLGLRHVALDNAIQFGSLFSERLITDVLRELRVKASRCNYARVYLNNKPMGVYVNVERIDRSFLERNFNSEKGVLFKVEGAPGAGLNDLGGDISLYEKAFELHQGKRRAAFQSLLDLIATVNKPGGTSAELRERMDLDSFVSTTAVLLLAGAFDQYTGWSPHNFYLYQDPSDKRWTYIPWDLDVGFADNAFGKVPVLEGWNAAWPAPVPGRPLMERIVSDPQLLQIYRKRAATILETYFQPEKLVPKLRNLYAQVESDLKNDPYPPRRVTVPSDSGYESILKSMEAFIRKRYALAREQLMTPGHRPPFRVMKPGAEGREPAPGPASADAPTDLRVESATVRGAHLTWVNHSEKAVAVVVQRCVGSNCDDFVNVIGQPGANVSTAIDPDVRAGMTYQYRIYGVLATPNGARGTGVSNVITVHVSDN